MPPPNQNAKYRSVHSLSRGLALLAALNISTRGQATSSQLGRLTGLHRTTVRRLLETLMEDGFVQRSESDDSFRLTRQVKKLSDGFTAFDRLSGIAMPIMGELMQKVIWPSCLCLPDIDAMQICESTHRFSPLSFHRGMIDLRVPFLSTSAGRAYFAFCEKEEREEILRILQNSNGTQSLLARDSVFIKNLIRSVRTHGYSTNSGEWADEKKVGAIAMPIFDNGRVLGSVNIVFLAHVLSIKQAEEKFIEPLSAAVNKISSLLSEEKPRQD